MGDAPAAAAAPSPAGKRRHGGEEGLRRVAEIVMVLAAAGEVRGGREPTAAERALVLEARERLAAAVAEGAVRPKDLFPGEAVRAVVEDLGLNRAKDPGSMGFRPPKASIADRLMLTKRKMEEVKEAPAQPTSAPQTIVSSGMSEFQGLHGAAKFGVGVPRNPPAATAPNSASLVILKPPGSSPAKPVNNSAGALPHTGPAHLKLEKDVNVPLNLARSGATIVHSAKSTPDTFARPNVNAIQSSNQVVKNQDTKPVAIQAATGNPVTGHRATPGVPLKPTFAHHNDIARSVQQFLHQSANHPSWTPPSTEYMNSRLCCQICKAVILDADSLLVCDACERGAHLICLQNYGNKGIPKPEWHCSVCLTQSKGKPLPPKYGKVTRTAATSKAAPPVNGAQFSLQGSAETMATKESHQNLAANGNPTKSILTQASGTVHNSNVLALSVTTAGTQSQLVSNLRPSVRNAVKPEATSSEKEGTGQACSSMVQNSTNTPPNKRLRSDSSLNSVDSANDIMHGKKTEEISGVKCADNSFAFGLTNIKLEHSEPLPSRDEEMVDHSETQMEQTRTVATEEKPRTQATFEPEKVKYLEKTTSTGTSTIRSTNSATEEKNHGQSTSEPHTISDAEITVPTETPICQSSNVAIEEKLKTDAAFEPNGIEDMEMSANNAPPIDQSNNLAIEEKLKTDAAFEPNGIEDTEMSTNNAPPIDQSNNLAIEKKPSEQTSASNDVEFTNFAAIPTNQSQHANGINGNGIKEPSYGDKNKSVCNAVSDHDSIQPVVPNGVLDAKDEMLCVREKEAVSASAEATEQAN